MNTLTEEIIKNRLEKEYPYGTNLIYIDRSDDFSEDKEALELLATTGWTNDGDTPNWMFDAQDESIDYILKEMFSDEEIEELEENDNLMQYFRDLCYEKDTSTPTEDLLRNTNERFYFYDLSFEINSLDYSTEEKEAKRIAKKLKIDYKKHEKTLYELVGNAYDGGMLTILFVTDPNNLYTKDEKYKYIHFEDDFELCIINRENGSGYGLRISESFTFKLIRENLHDDDAAEGYSYSGDTCGMCMWRTNTNWKFTDNKQENDIIFVKNNTEMAELTRREQKYKENYRNGKCTYGDKNFSRHRNAKYRNEYPCGNKCEDCGTFWVD